QLADLTETVKVPSVGERAARDLSRQALAEVVEPRYEELYSLVQAELRRSGYEDALAAGVVLTGGTALMEGAVELAEEIFHMPVRLAKPKPLAGAMELVNEPNFATSLGLLHYASEQQVSPSIKKFTSRQGAGKSPAWRQAKEWIMRNF
ncbi:MAG: rod shape-determining protein, partial [Gammaproteobacteria bacterium]|nr:rod shape-determining protein [Gammaproteobacteria bacterium]